MTLAPGGHLGPYEIVAPIGAGGMGEVYKARDTRLDRTVAIKVLPAAFATEADFKARFEREAKSISALNHPNICTLFDVGQEAATSFLVMEFLEGETLAARLAKGPVPVDQALAYASQIADALDKAHRCGIVHRDLKPANIFLVRSIGASTVPVCKLLDFGLAKMGVAAAPGTIETRLVTSPPPAGGPLTAQGTILGTFQYMAPEQVEGLEADARTDIWGFGCVLYEMLTGRRAFDGKSQASLIASILERQPAPMAELQPMTPPGLSRVVRTCLEKNPDNRFHTAHDLWLHLQWIAEGGSAAGLPVPVVAGRKRRNVAVFACAALGLAALAAAGAWHLKPAPAVKSVVAAFSYPLPEGVSFSREGRHFVAISPDGMRFAFVANERIYLRQLDELEAHPIRGSDVNPADLTFSPDGQSILFFVAKMARGSLRGPSLGRIAVTGGTVVPVCPASLPYGIRWDGQQIVFSLGTSIQAVDAAGGTPTTLVSVTPGSSELLAQPQLLDAGRAVLYTFRPRGANFDDSQIVVQSLPGGDRRVLVNGGVDGRVVPGGYLIYSRDGMLYAQAFDTRTLQSAGDPVLVVEGVRQTSISGAGEFALSDSGTLVFAPASTNPMKELVAVDRQGREERIGVPPHDYFSPRWSPDGTKIAAAAQDGDADIWVWDIASKTASRLTSGPDTDFIPVWTRNGQQIIFSSNPDGQRDLFRRAADGTGAVDRLTDSPRYELPLALLPDNRLLVRLGEMGTVTSLNALGLGGDGRMQPLIPTMTTAQIIGDVSPDGRWFAYQSPEGSTRDEIHVRPFPNTGSGHWQISSAGGFGPVWTQRGDELIYRAREPDPRMVVVRRRPAAPGASFAYDQPIALPIDTRKYRFMGRGYDVSADGQRLLMVKPINADGVGGQSLTVITHWFDVLGAAMTSK